MLEAYMDLCFGNEEPKEIRMGAGAFLWLSVLGPRVRPLMFQAAEVKFDASLGPNSALIKISVQRPELPLAEPFVEPRKTIVWEDRLVELPLGPAPC